MYLRRVSSSVSLVKWGTIELEADNCDSITMTMNTLEGNKVSASIKIVGVVGLSCSN